MRFGVQHAIGDPAWVPAILAPGAVRGFARAAEATGWDALGFTDHPAPSAGWVGAGGEGVAEPFGMLGFVAGVTEEIRLLTWVLVPQYRNPLHGAHQVATLDAVSGGRVTLGVGTGYLRSEMRALGVDPSDRLAAFDDAVDLMKQAWAGEEITVERDTWSARRVRVLPPVVQQPHPPIWLHGNSPWGLARAARWGQGWIGMVTDELLAETTRTTRLADIAAVGTRIAQLRERTVAAGRPADAVDAVATGFWPMLDLRRGWDVDACLEDVGRLEGLGADWIVVNVCGDDPAAAEDSVRAFGEQVVTAWKRSSPGGERG
ncbi:MAG: TIGR03619 family F420-dependent LLM class oxidoreductase [Acidimicrobiia bacterium]